MWWRWEYNEVKVLGGSSPMMQWLLEDRFWCLGFRRPRVPQGQTFQWIVTWYHGLGRQKSQGSLEARFWWYSSTMRKWSQEANFLRSLVAKSPMWPGFQETSHYMPEFQLDSYMWTGSGGSSHTRPGSLVAKVSYCQVLERIDTCCQG